MKKESGLRYLKGIKPLYDFGEYFIGWKKGGIFRCDFSGVKKKICLMPMNFYNRLLCKIRITERIFRLSPRWAMALNDHILIVSFHGAIYQIDILTGVIFCEHQYVQTMNNSLSVTRVQGLEGFYDGYYYGEYTGKRKDSQVAIWWRNTDINGKWTCVFRFKRNEITHVHSIVVDMFRCGLLILTGDEDQESGIWLAKNNFKNVEAVVRGKQKYRSCYAFPTYKGIIYATDSPNEMNCLYMLREKDGYWSEEKILELYGTTIYGTAQDEDIIISNSVETDSNLSGMKYMLSKKRGEGIKDSFVRVLRIRTSDFEAEEIFCEKKDFLPPVLGQFGAVVFANREVDVERILFYSIATAKKENVTYELTGAHNV